MRIDDRTDDKQNCIVKLLELQIKRFISQTGTAEGSLRGTVPGLIDRRSRSRSPEHGEEDRGVAHAVTALIFCGGMQSRDHVLAKKMAADHFAIASCSMPFHEHILSDPSSKVDACALETPMSNGNVNDLHSPVYHLKEDLTTLYCYRDVSQ